MFVASVAADSTLLLALAPLKLGEAIYCICKQATITH
jgi:hypothetical protein